MLSVLECRISGMSCAACVMAIEGHVKTIPGVLDASINLALAKGSFTFDPSKVSLEDIVEAVEDVGFSCEVVGIKIAAVTTTPSALGSPPGSISLSASTASQTTQDSPVDSAIYKGSGARGLTAGESRSVDVSEVFALPSFSTNTYEEDNGGHRSSGCNDTAEGAAEAKLKGSVGRNSCNGTPPVSLSINGGALQQEFNDNRESLGLGFGTMRNTICESLKAPCSKSVSTSEKPGEPANNIELGVFTLCRYVPVLLSNPSSEASQATVSAEACGSVEAHHPGCAGRLHRTATSFCGRSTADSMCNSDSGLFGKKKLPWNWICDFLAINICRRAKGAAIYSKIQDSTGQAAAKPPSYTDLQSFVGYLKSIPGVLSCSWKALKPARAAKVQKLSSILDGARGKQLSCTIVYDSSVVGTRDLCDRATEYFKNEWTILPQPPVSAHQVLLEEHHKLLSKFLLCAIPAATVGVLAMMPLESLPPFLRAMPWPGVTRCALLMLILTSPIHFLGGWSFHRNAFKGLIRGYATMDLLVSISTNVTFFFALLSIICSARKKGSGYHSMAPHFFETPAVVITAVLLGKTIEAGVKAFTSKSLQRETGVSHDTCRMFVLPNDLEVADRPGTAGKPDWNKFPKRAIHRSLVQLGDVLQSDPGEIITGDGVVLDCLLNSGVVSSPNLTPDGVVPVVTVDEAVVTGEAFPVVKAAGDKLVGGSMVLDGSVIYRVVDVGRHTFIGKVEALVEAANASKSTTQIRADRVSMYFIPGVLLIAALAIAVWSFLVASGRVAVASMGPHGSHSGLVPSLFDAVMFVGQFGIAVIAVACPCSLGLATPTAIAAATGKTASLGLLVKDIHVLERATKKVGCVVFDKTGTLTNGTLQMDRVVCTPGFAQFVRDNFGDSVAAVSVRRSTCTNDSCELTVRRHTTALDEDDALAKCGGLGDQILLWCAASVQGPCNHPIARSLRRVWRSSSGGRSNGLPPLESPHCFVELSGAGVKGELSLDVWRPADAADLGQARPPRVRSFNVAVGSSSFVKSVLTRTTPSSDFDSVCCPSAPDHADACRVYIAINGELGGRLDFLDSPRPEAHDIVATLRKQLKCEVWMLTGDGSRAANRIAGLVGIPKCNVRSGLRPDDKIVAIRQLLVRSKNTSVVMVGDGINDAGALAAATIGISVGAASSLVVTAADVVSIRPSLESLPFLFDLAQATRRIVWLNYFWAFAFNLVSLPLAAGVLYPMVMLPPAVAGLFMAGSSAAVVFNSLALLFIPSARDHAPATAQRSPAGYVESDDDTAPLTLEPATTETGVRVKVGSYRGQKSSLVDLSDPQFEEI